MHCTIIACFNLVFVSMSVNMVNKDYHFISDCSVVQVEQSVQCVCPETDLDIWHDFRLNHIWVKFEGQGHVSL